MRDEHFPTLLQLQNVAIEKDAFYRDRINLIDLTPLPRERKF